MRLSLRTEQLPQTASKPDLALAPAKAAEPESETSSRSRSRRFRGQCKVQLLFQNHFQAPEILFSEDVSLVVAVLSAGHRFGNNLGHRAADSKRPPPRSWATCSRKPERLNANQLLAQLPPLFQFATAAIQEFQPSARASPKPASLVALPPIRIMQRLSSVW